MTMQQALEHIRAKLAEAQTLLNAPAIALQEGRPAPSPTVRLRFAEEAEDLVHDAADLVDAVLLARPWDAVHARLRLANSERPGAIDDNCAKEWR